MAFRIFRLRKEILGARYEIIFLLPIGRGSTPTKKKRVEETKEPKSKKSGKSKKEGSSTPRTKNRKSSRSSAKSPGRCWA